MRALGSKAFRLMFLTGLFTAICPSFSSAAAKHITEVRVLPGLPIIETDLWTNTAGVTRYLLGDYEISDNIIKVDLYFLDYWEPDRLYACVCGDWTSTLDLGFLAQGDYEFEVTFWLTKDPGILDIPPELLDIGDLSDFDFDFWESYDTSFSFDQDYTSPFEPGLTFGWNKNRFLDIVPSPVDGGPIDIPFVMTVEGENSDTTSVTITNVPEPASLLLFASGLALLRRKSIPGRPL